MFRNKKGFTLAETLITLTILGVVAAVLVPSIIRNYQKRVTIIKLQKAYATIEKMATNIAANTGCLGQDLNCTGLLSRNDFTNAFIELSNIKYKKYISNSGCKVIKVLNFETTNYQSSPDVYCDVIVTKDNIGYYVSKSTIRTARNSEKKYTGVILYIFTEPDKLLTNKIVTGRNEFRFAIWDNFKVDPVWRVNSGEGPYLPFSKSKNASLCCDPQNTSTSVWYSGTGCTAKIIQDG